MGCSSYNCGAKNLSELRVVIATLRVNIMSLHILPIHSASNGRLSVSGAVRMKSWLTKVGSYSCIGKPSAHMLHFMDLVLDVLTLPGCGSSLLFF